jgi:hypothetical protein
MATAITCARCGKIHPSATVISAFDLNFICLSCESIERIHPDYQRAAAAALSAVQLRDRSFRGIGCPPELYRSTSSASSNRNH